MERLTARSKNLLGNAYYRKCKNRLCDDDCHSCEVQIEVDEKLKYYEDLEEQGLLLRLPHGINKPCYVVERCQCGTHYNCRNNGKASARRKAIVIGEKKTVGGYNRCMKIFERPFKVSYLNKIGVSVFLTRTEAEQALERMEKEK